MKKVNYLDMIDYLVQMSSIYLDQMSLKYIKNYLQHIHEINLFRDSDDLYASQKYYYYAINILQTFILIDTKLGEGYTTFKSFESFIYEETLEGVSYD